MKKFFLALALLTLATSALAQEVTNTPVPNATATVSGKAKLGQLPTSTYAGLPACAAGNDGQLVRVTDKNRDVYKCYGTGGTWISQNLNLYNVRDFGNNEAGIIAAIAAANSAGGGDVILSGGSYTMSAALVLASGVHIRGAGSESTVLDFSAVATSSPIVTLTGSIGSSKLLTANATVGTTAITVASGHGVVAGDLIVIGSDATFKASSYKVGEPLEVDSVGATTITVKTGLMSTYNTADNAYVAKVTPVRDVSISDLQILRENQVAAARDGIAVRYAYGLNINNVRVDNATNQGIYLQDCVNCTVRDSAIYNSFYTGSGVSYGIIIADNSRNVRVKNTYFQKFRCAVSVGKSSATGIPRDIEVSGNHAIQTEISTSGSPFDVHDCSEKITFAGNHVWPASTRYGFSISGYETAVTGNLIYGGGVLYSNSGQSLRGVVANNIITLTGSALQGITLSANDIIVTGNDIYDPLGTNSLGILVQSATDTTTSNLILANNRINNTKLAGIRLDAAYNTIVTGNIINSVTNEGILVYIRGSAQSSLVDITNNRISSAAYGIRSLGTNANLYYAGNRFASIGTTAISVPTGEITESPAVSALTTTFGNGTVSAPSVTFSGCTTCGFYEAFNSVVNTIQGTAVYYSDSSGLNMANKPIVFNQALFGSVDTGINRTGPGVVAALLGTSGAGWFQNSGGEGALAAAFTNATTTFASSNLSYTVVAGRSYRIHGIIAIANSTAGHGVQLDFNGGNATATTFWATATVLSGGTVTAGTLASSSLAGVINFTSVTGTVYVMVDGYLKVNAAGTFILRAAEDSTGGASASLAVGSWIGLSDTVLK